MDRGGGVTTLYDSRRSYSIRHVWPEARGGLKLSLMEEVISIVLCLLPRPGLC